MSLNSFEENAVRGKREMKQKKKEHVLPARMKLRSASVIVLVSLESTLVVGPLTANSSYRWAGEPYPIQ